MNTPEEPESGFWFMRRKNPGNGFGLMTEFDEFVKWEDHPLRYFFMTITLLSALTWLGFAGDNLQFHRSNGGLSFAGGTTFRQLWKNSWDNNGGVLLLFRLVRASFARRTRARFYGRTLADPWHLCLFFSLQASLS